MADTPIHRHVGKLVNTGSSVIVTMMQLPEMPTHALCIMSDSLRDHVAQAVNDIVFSPEGQNTEMLAEVLDRRLMPDTRQSVFSTLHDMGSLRPIPIEQIVMLPRQNMPFPLPMLLEQMGRIVPKPSPFAAYQAGSPPPSTMAPPMAPPASTPIPSHEVKFNPYTTNSAALSAEEDVNKGRYILMEAEDLEHIARQKREEAYKVAPSLRPAVIEPKPEFKGPEMPSIDWDASTAPKAARKPRVKKVEKVSAQ